MSWQSSEHIDELMAALVPVLGALSDVVATQQAKIETRGGGGFEYRYADLADVLRVVRPKLAEAGVAVMQTASANVADNCVEVSTTFVHTSGQWLRHAPMRLPASGDARAIGSSVTYARRYSLMAALGLATEDDDAAAAATTAGSGAQGRSGGRAGTGAPSDGGRARGGPRSPFEAEWREWLAKLPTDVQRATLESFRAEFRSLPAKLAVAHHRRAHTWLVQYLLDEHKVDVAALIDAEGSEGYG